MEQTILNANSRRRIHPGTKSADMAAGPPLVPLNELDSAFQLQEHLAALHYYHTANNTRPITREIANLLATPPQSTEKTLWLYELCRFLVAQCNSLIVGFLFDTPPCSFNTCPEMRASEWQFLCAVHEQPKSCCAIDYCCHTLDWAANVVTNPKVFPSRFVALSGGDGSGHDKNTAVKNLVNVFRRLHRIFAHAWFQHRGVFWSVEGQTGLYVFFKTVCDMFDTLPAENYKLPPEAEGLESAAAAAESTDRGTKKEQSLLQTPTIQQHSDDDNFLPAGRTNTRRHIRSSPSTGSAVTTVMEADEDDSADVSGRLREMRISTPETVVEESEGTEVPVIVEHGMMEGLNEKAAGEGETPATQDEPKADAESSTSASEPKADESSEPAPKEEASSDTDDAEAAEVAAPSNGQDDEKKEAGATEESKETTSTESAGDLATTNTQHFTTEQAADQNHEPSPANTEEDAPQEAADKEEADKADDSQDKDS
ncbi:putative mob1 family protein [Diaporthe ampelina]|uniref:Putative mob1 family protein n=1 Tax=Diaporthe ampelina TaxID=1214573 RepID=A0A0G2HUW3_9PEZI|nr:putative mob1 family protein [Diaporthe ampelina]